MNPIKLGFRLSKAVLEAKPLPQAFEVILQFNKNALLNAG